MTDTFQRIAGDSDQYDALKRYTTSAIAQNRLASHISIHNFSVLTSHEKTPLIFCIWPTPNKGYRAVHLLSVWSKIRKKAMSQCPPIKLIGHSTDSAGFSLLAGITQMTPSKEMVEEGIMFLGLDISEEKYHAPLFWQYPSISFMDMEHCQRSAMRNLKYGTLDLVFYKSETEIYQASVAHITHLRKLCTDKEIEMSLTEKDILNIKWHDYNPDAAYKLFNTSIADMLDMHVNEARATSLYIRMMASIFRPLSSLDFGNPLDVVQSLACGRSVLRLWKAYVEIDPSLRVTALPNASSNPSKRGNFITRNTYETLELLVDSGIQYQLILFLDQSSGGEKWASPVNAGTLSTEQIIGQIQGKTNKAQTLNSQPSVGEVIATASKLQHNITTQHMLKNNDVNIRPTTNRRRLHARFQKHKDEMKYAFPPTYSEFRNQLKCAYSAGTKEGQELVQSYLPKDFKVLLESRGKWKTPFVAEKPKAMQFVSNSLPRYDKTSFSAWNINQIPSLKDEDDKEHGEDLEDQSGNRSEQISSDEDDVVNSESNTEKHPNKWYIDYKGSPMHINRALKTLVPREHISRERGKRHWVPPLQLTGQTNIGRSHNVIRFSDVILKLKPLVAKVGHIISVRENGKDVASMSSRCQGEVNAVLYDELESDSSSTTQLFAWPTKLHVTGWLSVGKVVQEVTLSKKETGVFFLQEAGHLDTLMSLRQKKTSHLDEESSTENTLSEGEYEYDETLSMRINPKTHEYEYLTSFKGYDEKDNMWIPASAFRNPPSFSSLSRYGRKRKAPTTHVTNESGNID